MNSQTNFSSLKRTIQKACTQKNHLAVRDAALVLGFSESDESKTMTLAFKYERVEPDGTSVVLSYRSFDQSGPFQNLPDMIRFELRLMSKGALIEEFKAEYED